jgi:translation initiation factor IF-2
VLDLKANPERTARGAIVEAKLDKGKGITATVLVQKGTLKQGDSFVAGNFNGRVKAMFDERGHKVNSVKPATPVQVLGFDGMPQAGDVLVVMDSEREARDIALKRQQLKREQDFRQVRFITLDDISKQIKEGKQVDLNVIIKGDVDGSVEALSDSLLKLGTSEVKVSIIHKAIGEITEYDVLLAAASSAIIVGFNVRPNLKARKLAEAEKVDIRLHNIIYDVINEIKLALEGLLEPEKTEEVLATVEVRETFKVPKIGTVAGCYVLDGKVVRNNKVRLLRDGFVIFDGHINALKRFKDDVREVEQGFECGISLENFNDIKVKDIIESYTIIETKRKLEQK